MYHIYFLKDSANVQYMLSLDYTITVPSCQLA